jgi:hypothetical protein
MDDLQFFLDTKARAATKAYEDYDTLRQRDYECLIDRSRDRGPVRGMPPLAALLTIHRLPVHTPLPWLVTRSPKILRAEPNLILNGSLLTRSKEFNLHGIEH